MKIWLGVDGGGTRTRAVVINDERQVLGRGESASSNSYSVEPQLALKHVLAAVEDALDDACAGRDLVAGWGLGLAGAVSPHEQRAWHERLLPFATDILAPNASLERCLVVDEDAAAAHAGAFAGEPGQSCAPGVICIAGTGANTWGVAADGQRARGDGWGPLLGDRGSGYAIGEAALRETCLALDLKRDCALTRHVLSALEVERDELIKLVYAADFGKERIAALVPAVIAAWQEHDASAATILHDAALSLCLTTCAVVWQLEAVAVAPCGGVLSPGSYVRDLFAASLRYRVPGLQIIEPRHDASIGAALLAMSAIDN